MEITPVTSTAAQKLPSYFERYSQFLGTFQSISSVFTTISNETPNATQRNPCWETVVYTNIPANYSHQRQGISDSFVSWRNSDGTIFVTGNKSKDKGLSVNTIKTWREVEV